MKLSLDSDRRPYLILAVDELEPVVQWLIECGVDFEEDPEASQSCAGPVVSILRFRKDADVQRVQAALDGYGG